MLRSAVLAAELTAADPVAHPCMKMASVQKSSNQLQSGAGQQSRRFRRKMKCSTNSLNFCGPRGGLGRLRGEEGDPDQV